MKAHTVRGFARLWGSRPTSQKLRWLTALFVAVIAGFCAVSMTMLLAIRQEIWTQDVVASRNLITAEADDIARTVSIYALSLRSTRAALADQDILSAPPRLQQLALFDQTAKAAYLGAVRIITPDGTVTHDSGTLTPAPASPAERSALALHRTGAVDGLSIGKPNRSDSGGGPYISLSYRVTGSDGQFAGIVIGTIQIAYFNDLFRRLQLGPRDVVSLFLDDGTMLAHAPDPEPIGATIAGSLAQQRFATTHDGTFVARSRFSGVRRVYTFTHVDGWPLVLDVGLSVDDIRAPWQHRTLLVCASLLVMGGLGGALLLALRRELQLRLAAEQRARTKQARYRLLADHASDIILRFDARLVRTYVSPSCRKLGFHPRELIGGTPSDWVHPDDFEHVQAIIATARAGLTSAQATYRIRHRLGHYVWVEGSYSYVPSDGGFITVLRDVEQRRQAEIRLEEANAALHRLASLDGLTGLMNRREFDDRLAVEWRRALREGAYLGVLLVDVDHFKAVNDRFGHQAGDSVLQAVARTLEAGIRRPGDCVARYGGEEFVILLPRADLYGAIEVAESVRQAVSGLAITLDDGEIIRVSVSVGVSAACPHLDDQGVAALIREADQALYAAKGGGRNQVQARPAEPAAALAVQPVAESNL